MTNDAIVLAADGWSIDSFSASEKCLKQILLLFKRDSHRNAFLPVSFIRSTIVNIISLALLSTPILFPSLPQINIPAYHAIPATTPAAPTTPTFPAPATELLVPAVATPGFGCWMLLCLELSPVCASDLVAVVSTETEFEVRSMG
jgi:hypothetical protein